jgi:outer membrane biosynthesis protein TonB
MLDTAPPPAPPAASAARGQKIWAVLLVLDAFFVIVFGGALAAKVYQHLQAPAVPVVPNHRPRPVKPPEAAKPAEPAKPAPAPAPESKPAPKQAPKAAPAKAPAPAPGSVKPPKPSLLNEAPKHEAAQPHQAADAPKPTSETSAPSAPAGKAVPVNFSLSAPGAKHVELAGPFIVRGGGRREMKDKGDGQWALTLYLTPNTYRYHFLVDGKKTLDPQNPKTDRGASVLSVP